jgi:hypothetical protein
MQKVTSGKSRSKSASFLKMREEADASTCTFIPPDLLRQSREGEERKTGKDCCRQTLTSLHQHQQQQLLLPVNGKKHTLIRSTNFPIPEKGFSISKSLSLLTLESSCLI